MEKYNGKPQLLLIVTMFFAFMLLCVFYFYQTRDYAKIEAEKKIENYLLMHKAIHGYVERIQKPVIYELKSSGKLYDEFFKPEVLSFTFIARSIMGYYNQEREKNGFAPYYFKLASDNPRNDVNHADAFELELLDKMNKKELKKYIKIVNENGVDMLYYAIPINPNSGSCMLCHGDPKVAPKEMVERYGDEKGFKEVVGHTRAMISMKVPLESELKGANKVFLVLTVVTFAVMLLIYLITAGFIKKLQNKDMLIRERNKQLEEFNKQLEDMVSEETEKRVAQQQLLIQQSKMAAMGEMTAAVAHQWKQPLNAISLILQNIEMVSCEDEDPKKEITKMSEKGMQQIEFMHQTIENFRHFFKPEKMKTKFNTVEAVNEVVALIAEQITKSRIDIDYEINTDKTLANGNKNEFMQVILNLFTNSRDAIIANREAGNIAHGHIICRFSSSENNLRVEICDNGGGIPDESIKSIFDAYYTTKGDVAGTGIGLYMSKIIIEEGFEGFITVENRDEGACFIIVIPSEA